MLVLPFAPSNGLSPSGTGLTQPWPERSATSPVGASCWTDIAEPFPGQATNRSGALPAPRCARSAVCSWSVGASDAWIVTVGATFLYAASSGVQPTFASVMDVSFSVTGLPPALALPLSLGPLSWVPLPQAANATATSANPNRADLVIIT